MVKFKLEAEFKNTEIGEIPREWEIKRIVDVSNINQRKKQSNKKDIVGIKFISMEDIPTDGRYPNYKNITEIKNIKSGIEVYPGSILLAKITPSFEHGKMCIVPDNAGYMWFATTEVFTIQSKRGIINKWYLFYLLKHKSLRDILEGSMSGTSGRQRVQLSALKGLCIPFPLPDEQSRIATVLSWFDDLIENKKKQNEILEKTAMAIFKSWFVDFEPFKDGEFVDSELGRIPKGWEVKKVSDIANIILGGTPKRDVPEYWYGNIKWATAKDVANTSGIYVLKTSENISEKGLNHSNAKLLPKNTIIITARGTVGEIRFLGEPMSFNQTCYGLIPKNKLSEYFLFISLRYAIIQIKALSYGTVFDTITMRTFDEMKIIIPPQFILEKFHALVEPLFSKIIINQKEIMVLKKVRDALLPLLVFGRLRVEEV